ncbi:hypothetical protein GCM10023116_29490 [Kistimonas scapharcae]|uniref:Type II toxin-antitoxin system HigB family toxin n=1 Tax=Kistimonas scapharcae TaxID=1036133 RepID=A0ABP8V409_9GAMM
MRIITETRIKQAIEDNPQWARGLELWRSVFRQKGISFESFEQIRQVWKEASGWNTDRVPARRLKNESTTGDLYIFDIHGNDCRVVCLLRKVGNIFYVREVMSHADYDEWCKRNIK